MKGYKIISQSLCINFTFKDGSKKSYEIPIKTMEDNKYYTPDLEDIYLGYICQKQIKPIGSSAYWEDTIIGITNYDEVPDVVNIEKDGIYRTKYLDRFDIESLNWIMTKDFSESDGELIFQIVDSKTGNFHELTFKIETDGECIIEYWYNSKLLSGLSPDTSTIIFNGKCKSINELRKLMKLLDIKE